MLQKTPTVCDESGAIGARVFCGNTETQSNLWVFLRDPFSIIPSV